MYDILCVCVVHRFGNLTKQAGDLRESQLLLLDKLIDPNPVDQVHHQKVSAVWFTSPVNGRDQIRVLQFLNNQLFDFQPLDAVEPAVFIDFHRNFPIGEVLMKAFEDATKPTPSDQSNQTVRPDGADRTRGLIQITTVRLAPHPVDDGRHLQKLGFVRLGFQFLKFPGNFMNAAGTRRLDHGPDQRVVVTKCVQGFHDLHCSTSIRSLRKTSSAACLCWQTAPSDRRGHERQRTPELQAAGPKSGIPSARVRRKFASIQNASLS